MLLTNIPTKSRENDSCSDENFRFTLWGLRRLNAQKISLRESSFLWEIIVQLVILTETQESGGKIQL